MIQGCLTWLTLFLFFSKVSYISSAQYKYLVLYSSNIETVDVADARFIPRLGFLCPYSVYCAKFFFLSSSIETSDSFCTSPRFHISPVYTTCVQFLLISSIETLDVTDTIIPAGGPSLSCQQLLITLRRYGCQAALKVMLVFLKHQHLSKHTFILINTEYQHCSQCVTRLNINNECIPVHTIQMFLTLDY